MNLEEKAFKLKSKFGRVLAIEVCMEVIDVIERCETDDTEEETKEYITYWESIEKLLK